MVYDGIVLSILIHCPVPEEFRAYLLASYLKAPFLAATQEINYSTYIANHIMGHNAPESHQATEVLAPSEDSFLYTKCLRKIRQGFQIFSIYGHILW